MLNNRIDFIFIRMGVVLFTILLFHCFTNKVIVPYFVLFIKFLCSERGAEIPGDLAAPWPMGAQCWGTCPVWTNQRPAPDQMDI